MARSIFTVNAWVVDSNGTKSTISGYPKDFDSRNYGDDIDKVLKRAEGDMSEVWGTFCKRDDRIIQTVMLYHVSGTVLEVKTTGNFPVDPEPNSEPVSE